MEKFIMKYLLERWNRYAEGILESPSAAFEVVSTGGKIRARVGKKTTRVPHFVIKHVPTGRIIPSTMVKLGKDNAQGLAALLNSSGIEGIDSPNPSQTTLTKIFDLIRASAFAEEHIK
jgi:hypothetical protein